MSWMMAVTLPKTSACIRAGQTQLLNSITELDDDKTPTSRQSTSLYQPVTLILMVNLYVGDFHQIEVDDLDYLVK